MYILLSKHYKGSCGNDAEEYLIDTESDLSKLPKAPVGSYAICAENGRRYYCDSEGAWI